MKPALSFLYFSFSFMEYMDTLSKTNLTPISQGKTTALKPAILLDFRAKCPLLELAKFIVILFHFRCFSLLFNLEKAPFSTHYFSLLKFLVPIQYHCHFSLLCVVPVACKWINAIQGIIIPMVCKFT